MSTPPSMVTVVLAAGAGTRFGGGKLVAPVAGRPLLGRVLEVVDGFGERQVVVVGADADSVRTAVPPVGWEVVVAADWEDGPGSSLRAGLSAAPDAAAAMVVLGDLAWLCREAVERVLGAAARSSAVDAVRACEGSEPGHPLLVRGALLELARQAPDEGLRKSLAEIPVEMVDCTGLGVAADVDTPADLSSAERD